MSSHDINAGTPQAQLTNAQWLAVLAEAALSDTASGRGGLDEADWSARDADDLQAVLWIAQMALAHRREHDPLRRPELRGLAVWAARPAGGHAELLVTLDLGRLRLATPPVDVMCFQPGPRRPGGARWVIDQLLAVHGDLVGRLRAVAALGPERAAGIPGRPLGGDAPPTPSWDRGIALDDLLDKHFGGDLDLLLCETAQRHDVALSYLTRQWFDDYLTMCVGGPALTAQEWSRVSACLDDYSEHLAGEDDRLGEYFHHLMARAGIDLSRRGASPGPGDAPTHPEDAPGAKGPGIGGPTPSSL